MISDVDYSVEIQIGSNNQPFEVLVDTGSGDFWVFSSTCETCSGKSTLNQDEDNNVVWGYNSWSIDYESGTVSGVTVAGSVTIAGLSVPLMAFGAVDDATADAVRPCIR
jgi:Eukaryotic aspartyl protease